MKDNKESSPTKPASGKDSLLMATDICNTAGSAEAVLLSLGNVPPPSSLIVAQLAYERGDIEQALETAVTWLYGDESGSTVSASHISAYMLIAKCAMYMGDMQLWSKSRFELASLKYKSPEEKELIAFSAAAMDSGLLGIDNLPDWFKRGDFSRLSPEAFPAVRIAFAIYLNSLCHQVMRAPGKTPSSCCVSYAFVIVCELLTSQTAAEGVITAEIPLRLLSAVGYHNLGQDEIATAHIDRAIELALPNQLYSSLAEYSKALDFLLDERLGAADKKAQRHVRTLSKRFKQGWMTLHNAIYNDTLFKEFTTREQETAKLAAFGFTNQEIADRLHISLRSVKQALQTAMEKTCVKKRSELFKYV